MVKLVMLLFLKMAKAEKRKTPASVAAQQIRKVQGVFNRAFVNDW